MAFKKHILEFSHREHDTGYWTGVTFCGMHSEHWSDDFAETAEENVLPMHEANDATCKRCIRGYKANKRDRWETT